MSVPRRARIVGIAAGAALVVGLVLVVGPLLVPVPPLRGTLPPRDLAGPDAAYVDVAGLDVHTRRAGDGGPVVVLLHGFGASVASWDDVLVPLGEIGTAIAYDRPGFGLTERPLPGEWAAGQNPYTPEAQVRLLVGLMDALGVDRAVLVGNSAGGAVAAMTALRHPERVRALVLVSPAIYTAGGLPDWLRPLLGSPQGRRLGRLAVRALARRSEALLTRAFDDPDRVTEEVLARYRAPLRADDWDAALWEVTLAAEDPGLAGRLGEIAVPALVITGAGDRTVPPADTMRVHAELPDARLVVLPRCGHLPQEECPEAFLEAVVPFVREQGVDGLVP